jgi:predicted aminopeptidase
MDLSKGRTFTLFGPLLFILLFTGCDVSYYSHLARGQMQVLLKTRSVDSMLQDPSLPDSTRNQLVLVDSILAFAQTLGLDSQGQYTKFYDTGGGPISWNISASAKHKFEPYLWNFPFVGPLPYKGFFDRLRAQIERDELIALGYDVHLRSVSAYSTLGYFSDPLLSTMLSYPPHVLADLLIHELTHVTVYAKNQTDFNESLASFVGFHGSQLFLSQYFGKDTPWHSIAQGERADQNRFRAFMGTAITTLDSLYITAGSEPDILARREQCFSEIKKQFSATLKQYADQRYASFLDWELNNAHLLSYRRYNRRGPLFEQVFNHHNGNLKNAIQIFIQCGHSDDPWICLENHLD